MRKKNKGSLFFCFTVIWGSQGCGVNPTQTLPAKDDPAPASAPEESQVFDPPIDLVSWQTGSNEDQVTEPMGPGLLLIGGGLEPDDAFLWWNQQLNGGDVVVLRTSGADGYNDYIYSDLGHVDSVLTLMITSRTLADDPWVTDQIQKAEGIFLAGGDQSTYILNWKDTSLQEALMFAWNKGALLGGSSAGLAVLGEFIFDAKEGTVYSDEALANPYDKEVSLSRDFLTIPFLQRVITDSHFSDRDRMGRLITFIARLRQDNWADAVWGLGIDEGTAITVDKTGASTVYGNGAVYWISGVEMPQRCESATPLTYGPVSVVKFLSGDVFSLPSGNGAGTSYEVSADDGTLTPLAPY